MTDKKKKQAGFPLVMAVLALLGDLPRTEFSFGGP